MIRIMRRRRSMEYHILMLLLLLLERGGAARKDKEEEEEESPLQPTDPDLVVGVTLEMNCTIEDEELVSQNYNATNIRFLIGDTWMPVEETSTVDNMTAKLVHKNLQARYNAKVIDCYVCRCYTCSIPQPANCTKVGSTYMHVGYPPHKAKIINPKVVNWEYLTFEWEVKPNGVYMTTHTPLWRPDERAEWQPCPVVGPEKCRLERKDGFDPDHYQYDLRINSTSTKGGTTLSDILRMPFTQYVEVSQVRNLRVSKDGAHRLMLGMNSPKPGRTLAYQVRYNDTWQPEVFNEVIKSTSEHNVLLNVSGLVPYTLYSLHVRCIFTGSKYWSPTTVLQHKTLPALPGAPPTVTDGGFVYTEKNQSHFETRIFWKAPPLKLLHGEFKFYQVTYFDAGSGSQRKETTTKTWTVIRNLRTSSRYNFIVNVANSEGVHDTAHDTALRGISIYADRPAHPRDLNLTAIAQTEREVTLRWRPQRQQQQQQQQGDEADSSSRVASVTVYWCQADRRSQECQEDASLQWEKLAASRDSYTVMLAEGEYNMDYLFGISIEHYHTDGGNSSTGILWSHCTYSETEDYGKADVSVKSVDSMEVSLSIKPAPCRGTHGRAYVYAYNVILCPVTHTDDMCRDSNSGAVHQIVYATEAEYFKVHGLAQETPYRLQVTSLSAFKHHFNPHEEHITTAKEGGLAVWAYTLIVIAALLVLLFLVIGLIAIIKYVVKRSREQIHLDIKLAPADSSQYQSPHQQNYENIHRLQQHEQQQLQQLLPVRREIRPTAVTTREPTASIVPSPNHNELVLYNVPKSSPCPIPGHMSSPPAAPSLPQKQSNIPRRAPQDAEQGMVPPLVVNLNLSDEDNDHYDDYGYSNYQPTMYVMAGLTPETAADVHGQIPETSTLLGEHGAEVGVESTGLEEGNNSSFETPLLKVNLPLDSSKEEEEEEEEEEDEYLSTQVIRGPLGVINNNNNNAPSTEDNGRSSTAAGGEIVSATSNHDSNNNPDSLLEENSEEEEEEDDAYLPPQLTRTQPPTTPSPRSAHSSDIPRQEGIDNYSQFCLENDGGDVC